ncbi:MAG TPA: DUF6788 family protein [Trueperaceae bacterium]|nr:DUF6788 family protein [Trueperaceae bacterium]
MSPRRASRPLLRGTLFTLRRKCGKAGCRCATGDAHESPALAYPAGGRTKTMTLAAADVADVAAALARYRAAREELDAAADEQIANLVATAAARRAERRR